jgi:hypothetical protein
MTVNDFYLCLLPYPVNVLGTGGDCRKGSLSDPSIINHDTGALSYLSVTNATLFNVMADLFVKQVNAADIPPLMSGHVAVDTRNQELTGDIVWYDQPFPVGQDLWIAVHFPKGFRANYRYTNWTSQSVFDGGPAGGSYDNEYGTVDCPAGTSIKAHIDLVGGGTFSNDEVAQNFLCHIKGRTSPWYPNG